MWYGGENNITYAWFKNKQWQSDWTWNPVQRKKASLQSMAELDEISRVQREIIGVNRVQVAV